MKNLPNGCSCTELWVSPENWQTTTSKASLNKQWYVQCTYYDPLFKDKYPKGFPFRKKLNKFKTLDDRKAAAKILLQEIPKLFQDLGFNPITKQYMIEQVAEVIPEENYLTEICPETPFLIALKLAHESIKVADSTYKDIKYMLAKFNPAAEQLRYHELKISDVKRKHIRFTLDHLEKTEATFSAHKFNKYRGYLSTLFKELLEFEAVENDIVLQIQKRVHETKIRDILTEDERVRVNNHLKEHFPDFWRFTILFFHSGGRISELLNLKVEDVKLDQQKYQVFVKKGRQYKWVNRIIKDVALGFWIKSLYGANKNDYVFSVGLRPGPEKIRREQINRRWKTHVKDKLGITADFYALKHLNLDETTAILSLEDAAKMAGHKTISMVKNHYAVGEEERQFERLKGLQNKFA
ncbi:tyrosine-type recombinase/integrase [Flavobacterium lipolyticum]|uniref:Tyrosine-type recombinase/integrase n=1 Tax=Flavobacterium lipolyticum TaxID=2893754 RepID=A0ABS8LY96_9FLAO|nr:tyrosine-type recombinase/integrase [Flavobacterium sp. F-126]MCC9016913.1 tyrosine-type recombinase/integrase [Flavobacterium sp. F-126]